MREVRTRSENPSGKKERPKLISDASWGKAVGRAKEMAAEGDWRGAKAVHFVALHAVLFEEVYEFAPLDLVPETRFFAAGMAASLAKSVFGFSAEEEGSAAKMFAYVRWVWEREVEKEAWRKSKGIEGGKPPGWRLVFSRNLLNEYANSVLRKQRMKNR